MFHVITRAVGLIALVTGLLLIGCAHRVRVEFASEQIPFAAPPKPLHRLPQYELGVSEFPERQAGAAVEQRGFQHALAQPQRATPTTAPAAAPRAKDCDPDDPLAPLDCGVALVTKRASD